MKKSNFLLIICISVCMVCVLSGCIEQTPVSAETQKLIANTPPHIPVEYSPYLTLAGDGKSGAIVITVETPRGVQRRTLKTFTSDDGSQIDDANIRRYMNECNDLHNQIKNVRQNAAEASGEFKSAKKALIASDKNVTQLYMNLKSAAKAEIDTINEIESLKRKLEEQETILVQRSAEKQSVEKHLQNAQKALEADKSAFNTARDRFEAANAGILRTIESMGESNGQAAQR